MSERRIPDDRRLSDRRQAKRVPLAREVRFGDGRTHYEHHYKHQHHDHMICAECGKIIEFENDRIHGTIQSLPHSLARLVERLIPEEDWKRLGLHGLSERLRCKRIEALVEKEMRSRREFEQLVRQTPFLELPMSNPFATAVESAIVGEPPKLDSR